MADPTFADATTAQTQTQVRDGLLVSLAADGSVVGGLPISSPDRGLVEAEAAQLALEQRTRVQMAQSLSVTTAVAAGDTWLDAAATWFQVDNGAGGFGRIGASYAVWTLGLVVASTAAPVALQPGDQIQIQGVDSLHSIFTFSSLAAVTLSAGSSYKGVIQVTARAPGTVAGNITADQLKTGQIIASPYSGLSIDPSITPALVTVARDQESSPALRDRCLASWGRLGLLTKQGADYLIPLFDPNATQWLVRDDNPYGPGTVGVVLGDSGGVAAVSAGLNGAEVRPLGSGLITVTAVTPSALTVTAALANDGSNATLHADATAALALLQGAFPIGGTLDPSVTTGLLRGDPVGTVPVVLYDGSTRTVTVGAPGFGSVSGVTLSGACASPVVLAWTEKLVITPAVTP